MTIYDKILYNNDKIVRMWVLGGHNFQKGVMWCCLVDKHWGVMTPEWVCDTPMGRELTGMIIMAPTPVLYLNLFKSYGPQKLDLMSPSNGRQ